MNVRRPPLLFKCSTRARRAGVSGKAAQLLQFDSPLFEKSWKKQLPGSLNKELNDILQKRSAVVV
jgi:hypothetical protein